LTATYNLVCPQATTFNFQFTINNTNSSTGASTPWNLTGYTATMTVRPAPGVTTTTLLATTANGRIVIDPTYGRITVTFTSSLTNIPANSYVYDLVLYSGSVVTRILEGQFIVTAGVTV
jgi:hypothetical protein